MSARSDLGEGVTMIWIGGLSLGVGIYIIAAAGCQFVRETAQKVFKLNISNERNTR